jgi:hypothetical protein
LVSKIWKINNENYKKINSVSNRPMLILYKYYYCFLKDTSVAQFHGKTVFILWLRSIQISDVLTYFSKNLYAFNFLSGITNLFLMLSEVTKMFFAELISYLKYIFIIIEIYLYYFNGKTSCWFIYISNRQLNLKIRIKSCFNWMFFFV